MELLGPDFNRGRPGAGPSAATTGLTGPAAGRPSFLAAALAAHQQGHDRGAQAQEDADGSGSGRSSLLAAAMAAHGSAKAPVDENTGTAEENQPTPETAGPRPSEAKSKFQRGAARLKFLARLNKAAAPVDYVPPVDEIEFVPETRRRFTFDADALKKGGNIHDLFLQDQPPEEDFNDIVDQDDNRAEVFISQELVGTMIESTYFRIFIFGLIIVNSMLIGMQTDQYMSDKYQLQFYIFDQLVMSTFVCEILLKWYYGFWIFWKVGWNVLDFLIIVALLLGPELSFLSTSRILRILRVLRAFRSLRSVSATAGLSMVVQTVLQSVPDMANICLLLSIILLMLGVAGVTLFGKHVPDSFGDLQSAMFSLFICTTQDGWADIFAKFKELGGIWHIGGALYFFVSIMVGAFVFANLVVAVVVTNLELAMRELKAENEAGVDVLEVAKEMDHYDPLSPETTDTVPIVTYETIPTPDLASQTPLHISDMTYLTLDRLERYLLILGVVEENLHEYMAIRNDLDKLLTLLQDLNMEDVAPQNDSDLDLEDDEMLRPAASRIDMEQLKKGDILSNLMRLEAKDAISSAKARNMSDVIRTALQPRDHPRDRGPRPRSAQSNKSISSNPSAGRNDPK